MKYYGDPDEDKTALNLLLSTINEVDVQYILQHQRKPVDAKPCQLPGSVTVQAVMLNSSVVTVRQDSIGGIARHIQ